MKKVIVTFTIGRKYQEYWKHFCEQSWRTYAAKHGYDLLAFSEPLDPAPAAALRSVNWQKLLLFSSPMVAQYDRAVWLDADIMINHSAAPCIAAQSRDDKIGLVLYGDLQVPEERLIHNSRWVSIFHGLRPEVPLSVWSQFFENYYPSYGLDKISDLRFNTGVMVFTPSKHAGFFSHVYHSYQKDAFDQEQTALNYELLKQQEFSVLDRRFNIQVGDELIRDYPFLFVLDGEEDEFMEQPTFRSVVSLALLNIFQKSYFTHFCGSQWPLQILGQVVKLKVDYRGAAKIIWGKKKKNQAGP